MTRSIYLLECQLHVLWGWVVLPACTLLLGLLQKLLGAELQPIPSFFLLLITSILTRDSRASSGLLKVGVVCEALAGPELWKLQRVFHSAKYFSNKNLLLDFFTVR